MFDEFLNEIKKLAEPTRVSIDMPLDDKGCFDRHCPNEDCAASFKVLFEDWRDKVSEEAAFCPKCGKCDEPDAFNTQSV